MKWEEQGRSRNRKNWRGFMTPRTDNLIKIPQWLETGVVYGFSIAFSLSCGALSAGTAMGRVTTPGSVATAAGTAATRKNGSLRTKRTQENGNLLETKDKKQRNKWISERSKHLDKNVFKFCATVGKDSLKLTEKWEKYQFSWLKGRSGHSHLVFESRNNQKVTFFKL